MFWSQALSIESVGGGYIAEYIFFIMFSVSLYLLHYDCVTWLTEAGIVCYMCCYPSTAICAICSAEWYPRSEDHARWFRDKEILNELDVDRQVCRIGTSLGNTNWRILLTYAQCLTVASGLWLGKEGPLVHVACCIANLLLQLTPILNDNEGRIFERLPFAL